MISAVVIISTSSWYPLSAVLHSLTHVADEIIVNIDSTDTTGTKEEIDRWVGIPIRKILSPWNWRAKDKGQELARQTNLAIQHAKYDWILDVQADEILHEDEHKRLIDYVRLAPADVSGFRLTRLYFFERLDVLRADWTVPLTRLFRKGSHIVAGDAMDTQHISGRVVDATGVNLYHYSRVGDSKEIVERIMSLSRLFHERNTLQPPTEYDWKTRLFDTFSTDNQHEAVDIDPEDVLVPFTGSHPRYYYEWLKEKSREGEDG